MPRGSAGKKRRGGGGKKRKKGSLGPHWMDRKLGEERPEPPDPPDRLKRQLSDEARKLLLLSLDDDGDTKGAGIGAPRAPPPPPPSFFPPKRSRRFGQEEGEEEEEEGLPFVPKFDPADIGVFPANIQLHEARSAISGCRSFTEKHRDGLIIFDYKSCRRGTFPDPLRAATADVGRQWQIRRECRGLMFSAETGRIAARRFHKFFNVGELPETQPGKIDALLATEGGATVLVKLDGSMISSVFIDGSVRFCTKMGLTEVAVACERYVASVPHLPFGDFCRQMMERGWTPLFEFTSPMNPIKVSYRATALTLLAARNNLSGDYMPFSAMCEEASEWGIPCVDTLADARASDVGALRDTVWSLPEMEGCVLRLDLSGRMFKIKTQWYVGAGQPVFSLLQSERALWQKVLLNELDDVIPSLEPKIANHLRLFRDRLWSVIESSAQRLQRKFGTSARARSYVWAGAALTPYEHALRRQIIPGGPGIKDSLVSFLCRLTSGPRKRSFAEVMRKLWSDGLLGSDEVRWQMPPP